ncbi:hypothetical protein [Nocardioides cynanchi]|uniref:hypothetical protein n=1 Tax=Nocardioides cynanchi TaxID=2558918 RepID=UPI0012467F11|nr:hypothetical protein [Nocardioides cynanchi]
MTRVRRLAAVAVTMAAAVLATTAQHDPATAATADGSDGHADRAPATTALHIHITGCNRCTLTLQHAVHGQLTVWTSKPQRIGADEAADFRLLTARTHGLSFVLRAPWEGNTGAVPNLVTRYRGHKIDSPVTRAEARAGSRAEGCWAGTSVDSARLSFHVARVPGRTIPGKPTQIPLAYATHTMSSWRPMVKTYKGTIANQDAFWCTRPKTTTVTFAVPGCSGCQIGVMNGARRVENAWSVAPRTVRNGSISFRVPRPLTRGISATVVAPWEGATGYTTVVAWRYAGHRVGDAVTLADARSRSEGSPCWGGTTSTDLTVPLTVRQVTVPGTTGPTAGTIAFARVTQPWLKPLLPAGKGVIGSQEVIACRK